jgi:hypothetical protein
MTYLRLAAVSLLLLCSQLTFADSIKTYQITSVSMQLSPNDGSGDDLTFTFSGPHIQFSGIGGVECTQCFTDPIYDNPTFDPSYTSVSLFGDFVIDGVTYSGDGAGFEGFGLFNDHGGLNSTAIGDMATADSSFQFNLKLPTNGSWDASYTYYPPSGGQPGYWLFNGASFDASAPTPVPEPATSALTLTGLAGILGAVKKKHLRR